MKRTASLSTITFLILTSCFGNIQFVEAASAPVVNTTIAVEKTGSEPFDSATWSSATNLNAGNDENEYNNVVRLQDSVTYKVEASVNDASVSNLVAEVLLDKKQAWIQLPTGCQTDKDIYPNLDPISTIVDSTTRNEGGDKRLMICNMGPAIEGTNNVFYPAARAIGASYDGTQITINDDHISASVSTYADTNSNTASDGPTDTIVTAGFKVNLVKELKVTALDPDTNEPIYKAPAKSGPSGEQGSLIEYVIKGTYQHGSMIADSDEITFEEDFNLIDYFTDNNTGNDGALSSNGILYTRGPDGAAGGCSLIGDHGTNAAINCTQNNIAIDVTSSNGSPDSLNDANIDIALTDIDVRDPDADANLFEFRVNIRFNRATEIQTHQSCALGTCETFITNGIGTYNASTNSVESFEPVSTEDAGGNNLLNYNGAGAPFPSEVDYSLIYTTPGSYITHKSFHGMPWTTPTKFTDQNAAAGEIIPFFNNVFDYRKLDGAKTQMCDKIDTSVFEYVGISDAPRTDMNYGFNHRSYNPSINLRGGTESTKYTDGKNHAVYLYSDHPHTGLAGMRDDTCEDDINEDAVENIMNKDGVESNPGNTIDRYEDPDMVPGGRSAITHIRTEATYDQAFAIQNYPTHNNWSLATNFEVRVKQITNGYGRNNYLPNFMVSRRNNGTGTAWGAWTIGSAADIDPEEVNFSYEYSKADRMKLIPSNHSIRKVTNPEGIKVVRGGDNVEFILTPSIVGLWDDVNQNTATVHDNLPTGTDYVFGSEMFSTDGGNIWMNFPAYMQSSPDVTITNLSSNGHEAGDDPLVWKFGSIDNGDQLPLIKYTVHVDDTLISGTYKNTVKISSPMGDDVDGDGNADDVSTAYQLSIYPEYGFEVLKSVGDKVYDMNTPFTFDLVYKNLGGESYSQGEFIDILPYQNDQSIGDSSGIASSREPGTTFNGTYEVTKITSDNNETFLATDAISSSISTDPCHADNLPNGYIPTSGDLCYEVYTKNANTLPGGSATGLGTITWQQCTATTQPVTCGSINPSNITAIKFTTPNIPTTAGGRTVSIELTPEGNVGGEVAFDSDGNISAVSQGDIYTNTFGGRVPEISLRVISNDVSVTIVKGSIGNYVWYDLDEDGEQDSSEQALSGVVVHLYDEGGSLVDSTTTNQNGLYLFDHLPQGDYTVTIVPPAGYVSTDNTDDGIITQGFTGTTTIGPVYDDMLRITSLDDIVDMDFGLTRLSSLGDTIRYDSNADGIQDSTESGVEGVIVRLLDENGNVVEDPENPGNPYEVTTNGSGEYLFVSLSAATYIVEIVPPTGYEMSSMGEGNDIATDSNFNPIDMKSEPIVLESGEENLTIDGGIYQPGALGDTVREDTNGDGIQDSNEVGIPGTTVYLLDEDGESIDDPSNPGTPYIVTTNGSGEYLFEGLTPGEYQVQFDLPNGYEFTQNNTSANNEVDSNANQDTGITESVTVVGGETNTNVDAGAYLPASLGDTVRGDKNADGIQDSDEEGIEGITVGLYDGDGNEIEDPSNPGSPYQVKTNNNGEYLFESLVPGDYKVRFFVAGIDPFSPQNIGTDGATDSNANPSNGETDLITLESGDENLTIDAGIKLVSIGDTVRYDTAKNGIQDTNETGVAGVIVSLLDKDGQPIDDPANPGTPYQILTDSNGSYLFENILAGDYTLSFAPPQEQGAVWKATSQNQGGDDSKDSDIGVRFTTDVITVRYGLDDFTIDAGIYKTYPGNGTTITGPDITNTPDQPQEPVIEETPETEESETPQTEEEHNAPFEEEEEQQQQEFIDDQEVKILPTREELMKQLEDYKEQFIKEITHDEGESGNHYFQGTPKFLQTGIPLEEGIRKHGINILKDERVRTDAPDWGKSHDQVEYPKDLQYRLDTVLLPHDPTAGGKEMYVLIPEAGYLLPIVGLEGTPMYSKLINGQQVSVKDDLQEIFTQGIVHHAGSVNPGELGRFVAAMHSSWRKDLPGTYIEGNYPTIGQILVTLEEGDDIVYFVKQPDNSYEHYTYTVNTAKEVDVNDVQYIYPTTGHEAMLYTCTDFGASQKRFVVVMSMKETNTSSTIVQPYIASIQHQTAIDNAFMRIEKHGDLQGVKEKFAKIRDKLTMLENNQSNASIQQLARYIKFKIAFSSVRNSVDISTLSR